MSSSPVISPYSASNLPRLFQLSLLLVCVPLPFILALAYLSGDFRDCVPVFFGWLALAVVYWWPIGALLFHWKRGWFSRFVIAYLASLPLYFLCLLMIYPAFGARFHPSNGLFWSIYLGQSPTFFLFVFILYLLTRRGGILMRVTTVLVWAAFIAGLLAPFVYALQVDRYTWPALSAPRANIIGARLVDISGNQILDGKNVHIEDHRIVAIVDAFSDSSDWPKIDAAGNYLLPGLIDVHVHLQAPVRSILSPFDFKFFLETLFASCAPQRRAYLENGVTSIRDDGGSAARIFALRGALQQHKLLGPRLFAVGRLVTSPHGHPVSTIWTPQLARDGAVLASDSATLLSGLEKNYAAGPPDAVKFIYGTIGIAKEKLRADLLEQGIAWTKQHRLISIVHAETTAEVTEAARAGATGIEHVASIEALPDTLIHLLVENRSFADPTFGEFDTALQLRNVKEEDRSRQLQEKYEFIRRLNDAGVRLTIGTDAPLVPYGTGFHDELAQFSKAGFTPAEILRFATLNNAAYLGKPDSLGQIAPGFLADLVLVKENPLQNLATLRSPLWVMLDGQIVSRPTH
jgi:imidazolonepropionase-like amidohydrolase